jgi:hypothetical protein
MSEPGAPETAASEPGAPETAAPEPGAPETAEPEQATAGPRAPRQAIPGSDPEPATAGADLTMVTEAARPRRRIPRAAVGGTILAVLLAGISVAVFLVSAGPPSQKGPLTAASIAGATAKPASGDRESAARASAAPGSQPGAAAIGDTPVAAVTGPKPLAPTDPATVKSWNAGRGGAALARVTAYSGNVLMAYGSGLYPQTLQACAELAGAVKQAQALPPIPSSAMQKMYVRSLDAFKNGVAECEAAITQHPEGVEDTVTNVNHTKMNKAIAQFSIGTKDLYIATEFLRKQ